MKLIPWTGKSESPARLWPDTSRLFEDFFSDRPFLSPFFQTSESWRPAVDILEKDGNLILRAEVPGMEEKDIGLKLEGNVLTLHGMRHVEDKEDRNSFHRVESFGNAVAGLVHAVDARLCASQTDHVCRRMAVSALPFASANSRRQFRFQSNLYDSKPSGRETEQTMDSSIFSVAPVRIDSSLPRDGSARGSEKRNRSIAKRAAVTCFFTLTIFAWTGTLIFKLFGITLPAFKIAGGILLF